MTPPLTHELAATIPGWGRLVGRVAEDVARDLENHARPRRGTPTPITGRRRSEGRHQAPPTERATRRHGRPGCSWCGAPTGGDRKTCSDDCAGKVLAETHERFAATSSQPMRSLARDGINYGLAPEANERSRQTRKAVWAAQLEWGREHTEPVSRDEFVADIRRTLAGASARAIARATGLSVGYCARIKRGERVPHARWWSQLRSVSSEPESAQSIKD